MEQDLKGSVVNGVPGEPQSRTLSEPAGKSKSCFPHHVVADFVSFATAFSFSKQTPSLIHSVAPPFQIGPASLGSDLDTGSDFTFSGAAPLAGAFDSAGES